jgi:molecular chaperone DnaK (HSP70)
MSSTSPFFVGIDLGTTNSALAWVDGAAEATAPRDFHVPQLVRLGHVEARATLPSFLYLAEPGELPPGSLRLPWAPDATPVVGTLARDHGAKVPAKLVSSAKSWLCWSGADRRGDILPSADAEGTRISPVAALSRYLEHLRSAWNHEHTAPGTQLEDLPVVLTVPASFDPVARQLTVEAAERAGIPTGNLTLLEEPTAALYAWLAARGEGWRDTLAVGDTVLVVDIGGGTSDFSLVSVREREGVLELERVAVGEHILLGGDNMDLMLAHIAQRSLSEKGTSLDPWQSRELWHACREAKEALLGDPTRESYPVVVQGRGSRLIGGQVKVELYRDDVSFVLEAFFPECAVSEAPKKAPVGGLRQVGLPYATDAAVTRHLAAFLTRHAATVGSADFARPTALLFNGGVFQSPALRARVVEILNGWLASSGAPAVRVLEHDHLDLAVSRGAAYYALASRGKGIRIKSGAAQAYYVGVESSLPAVPGMPAPMQALCVVPRGLEAGTELEPSRRTFHLVLGEPARFQLLASATRVDDAPGSLLPGWAPAELTEVAVAEVTLHSDTGSHTVVPVRLRSRITDVGTLELWCVSIDGAGQWRLEYDIRAADEAARG